MILEKVVVGELEVNCYILGSQNSKEAIIIDPGDDAHLIRAVLAEKGLTAKFIINTHGHADHIGADDELKFPIYAHKDEVAVLRSAAKNFSSFLSMGFSVKGEITPLEEGQEITLSDIILEVIHTPGHTPGGICLLLKKPQEKILFTGDTLFCGSVGRTDFPGASQAKLLNSIKTKLLVLADDVVIYPGHGPRSTIGQERKANPFLV